MPRAHAQHGLTRHGRTTPHKAAARKHDDPQHFPPGTTQGEHTPHVTPTATRMCAAMSAKLRFVVGVAPRGRRLIPPATKFALRVWQSK